eukprot:141820_1
MMYTTTADTVRAVLSTGSDGLKRAAKPIAVVAEPFIPIAKRIGVILFWVAGLIAAFVGLLAIAIVLYTAIYLFFVPDIFTARPVYFDFSEKEPIAEVNLVNHQWEFGNETIRLYQSTASRLKYGVEYNVALNLRIPDSLSNENIGMIMISTTIYSCGGKKVAVSRRPVLPVFRNWMTKMLLRTSLIIPYTLNILQEDQRLSVNLLEGFVEDSLHHSCKVEISISKPEFQIYDATVRFDAQLAGLSYWLYYYFFTSTAFGIACLVCLEAFAAAAVAIWLLYVRPTEEEEEEVSESSQEEEEEEDTSDEFDLDLPSEEGEDRPVSSTSESADNQNEFEEKSSGISNDETIVHEVLDPAEAVLRRRAVGTGLDEIDE